MAATPAKSLERYDLLDRIAVGGMAEVFRAVAHGAHGFEKTLAIKRILPELARDPEFEERFIGEAKLAVGLTHANVVQVFDFGRFAGSLFIAMELVDGLDLAALLQCCRDRDEPIRLPAAFQIAIELARGLDYAHRHGVVHRDVSPSNILLARAGEVKIADFGIALALDQRSRVAGDERRVMGKWRYMSPEQTAGAPLDPRSDLFSAAVVMYEVFTGAKLFPGDDTEDIVRNIRTMPIPRASELRPGLPPEVDDILARALAREPADRTHRAADLLRALTEASYKSSLVATALDVADTVEEALAAGAGGSSVKPAGRALDDLIRAQLLGGQAAVPPVTQRRTVRGDAAGAPGDEPGDEPFADTAVAEADAEADAERPPTMVRAGVDADGVTIWELDRATVAAGPAALRSVTRPSGELAAAETRPAPRWRSPGALVALIVTGLVAAGGWWWLGRDGAPATARVAVPPVAGPPDAAVAAVGLVTIESDPSGAQIWIDGVLQEALTPASIELDPSAPHVVELAVEGHRPWRDDRVSVTAGERLRLRPKLELRQASLIVRTRPEGAEVSLDGEPLGVTPLGPIPVPPGPGRRLRIEKPGFRTVDEPLDLVDEQVRTVERRLSSAVVYGQVDIHIRDSWAQVSLDGKALGTVSGSLRLPVGTHALRLHNPQSGKERVVTVKVSASETLFYEFEL